MEAPASSSPSSSATPPEVNHPSPDTTNSPPHRSRSSLPLVIGLIFAFLGVLLLAFWYFQTLSQRTKDVAVTPSPAPVVSTPQKLVVGTDPTLQPMEYLENEKIVGYDIDLVNFIAKELGAEVEFKSIVFDDLFSALEQKDIDMIVSAVTITQERQQRFDFSSEYLNAGQVVITKRTDNVIKSTADLRGKKIAVQKGTTNEAEALKYTSDNLVIRYPDFEQATKALVSDSIDAIFTDLPSAKGITLTNPTLKIAGDPFTNEYYGIVFRKGDPSVSQINKALKSLDEKGILAELKQKWLN